jgi:methyl-accepting chemotaxis protein
VEASRPIENESIEEMADPPVFLPPYLIKEKISLKTEDHIHFKLHPFTISKDLKGYKGNLHEKEFDIVKTSKRLLGREKWGETYPVREKMMSFFEASSPVPPYVLIASSSPEQRITEWFDKILSYYNKENFKERWIVVANNEAGPDGWAGVVLEIDPSMSGHPVIKRMNIILAFTVFLGLGFLVTSLFALWLASDVSEPLSELAKAMAESDDEGSIGQAAILSDDEIGELAANFNILNTRLQKENRKKEELLSALRQAGINLGDVMERLVVIASEHGSDSAEQAASLQQISSTSEEIAATLRGIAENTQMVEEVAGKSLSSCGEGQQQLGDLASSMDAAIAKVKDVADRMISFHEQTNRIETILNFLRDVSEKINIIALNASIEAAASGDSGSRFQILAASMRELAEKTMTGAKETKEMFAELQSASNSAIIATEESEKQVELAKDLAEKAADSFQRIIHWAGETVRTTQEISISSNQQTSASDHLAEALSEIKEVASKYAESGNVLEKSLTEISGTSRYIKNLLEQSREFVESPGEEDDQ